MIKFTTITEQLTKDSGLIKIGKNEYLFRKDPHNVTGYIAWDIHEDPGAGGKIKSHKWPKLPHGIIQYFDLDHIPKTIKYIPALD